MRHRSASQDDIPTTPEGVSLLKVGFHTLQNKQTWLIQWKKVTQRVIECFRYLCQAAVLVYLF